MAVPLTDSNSVKTRSRNYPAHERVADELRRRIQAGAHEQGGLLASRRELADEFGVSVATMQKAITILVSDGILEMQGRWKTFVGSQAAAPGTERAFESASNKTRSSASVVIGILWRSDEDPNNIWTPVICALEREVSRHHWMPRYVDFGKPANTELSLTAGADRLIQQGANGLISLLYRPSDDLGRFFGYVERGGIPLVHAGPTPQRNCALSVTYSNVDAGFHAANHLISRGCRTLLFFSGFTTDWCDQRQNGAREAVLASRLPASALRYSVGGTHINEYLNEARVDQVQYELAIHSARKLIAAEGLPADGVMAFNDHCALAFQAAAQEAGYREGVDYALIGFDNIPAARDAGLSSFQIPYDSIGTEVVNVLCRAISNPQLTMRLNLPFELVARESTVMYPPKEAQQK